MSSPAESVEAQVADADVVLPEGARTQWSVGAPPRVGTLVRAPADHLRHDPDDLTVSVDAGVTVGHLGEALAEAGQECPIDAREDRATLGGVVACGLSSHRRLRHGPLRDRLLGVEFVLADGRRIRGGGPTVKNVTGYDLPRLMVGSFGTLALLTRFTLRCTPVPAVSRWGSARSDPDELRRRLFRPACVAWDGEHVWALVEGHGADADAEMEAAGLAASEPPEWPGGPFRGRISVRPGAVRRLGPRLAAIDGLRWLAETGVGTVHVAADRAAALTSARAEAAGVGGWMLVEAADGEGGESGPQVEPFGRPLPNGALLRRLKAAFDPDGKMNPGRLPL